MAKPIGVKIRKNNSQNNRRDNHTEKTPSCIHSLLKGNNISAFIKVANKITVADKIKIEPKIWKVFV